MHHQYVTISRMDSYIKCRLSSEKVNWNFQDSLSDLQFDYSKRFLPLRFCGKDQPQWITPDIALSLNQLRGYSYAHLFLFVEEFIILENLTETEVLV